MHVCYQSSPCGLQSPLVSLHDWQTAAPVTAAAAAAARRSCRGAHRRSMRPIMTASRLGGHCSVSLGHRSLGKPAAASASSSFSTADATRVRTEDGQLNTFPSTAGVYAVFSPDGKLQYIGLSRKIAASVAGHAAALPDMTHVVRYEEVQSATKEDLTSIWQEWVQAAVSESGNVPPGNEKGNTTWSLRRAPPKPEIKLTPGKGVQDLACSVEDLVEQVVKSNKVVAFIKGTRTQPQCGFSHKVLTILNEAGAPYEVVNVLDEHYNPGLREAIKRYSEWPTIPQLYIKGEFVGGADIVEEMHGKGELRSLLQV